jgi:rubrerythrin
MTEDDFVEDWTVDRDEQAAAMAERVDDADYRCVECGREVVFADQQCPVCRREFLRELGVEP